MGVQSIPSTWQIWSARTRGSWPSRRPRQLSGRRSVECCAAISRIPRRSAAYRHPAWHGKNAIRQQISDIPERAGENSAASERWRRPLRLSVGPTRWPSGHRFLSRNLNCCQTGARMALTPIASASARACQDGRWKQPIEIVLCVGRKGSLGL